MQACLSQSFYEICRPLLARALVCRLQLASVQAACCLLCMTQPPPLTQAVILQDLQELVSTFEDNAQVEEGETNTLAEEALRGERCVRA